MIVYNTTFQVDELLADKFVAYLREVYIPISVKSGVLQKPALRRLIHEELEGASFALQFHVDDREALELWKQRDGKLLQRRLVNVFGNQFVGFSTLLEEIALDER